MDRKLISYMAIEINERIFTAEERNRIQKYIDCGNVDAIIQFMTGGNITPQKEFEVQKIVDALRSETDGFVSTTRKKMDKLFGGNITPEKEEEISGEMQKEFQEWKKKHQKEKEVIVLKEVIADKKEEIVELQKELKELSAEEVVEEKKKGGKQKHAEVLEA